MTGARTPAPLQANSPDRSNDNGGGRLSFARTAARVGSSKKIDDATEADLGHRLGHDFSRVRIHDDAASAAAVERVGARAFTVGSDIIFGKGLYSPGTGHGLRLLTHELVHVVQQARGAVSPVPTSAERERDEVEAREVTERTLAGRPAPITLHRSLRSPASSPPLTLPVQFDEPGAGVQDADAGTTPSSDTPDAGFEGSLPGGTRPPPVQRGVSNLADHELGPELERALATGDSSRVDDVELEMERRFVGASLTALRGPDPVTSGTGAVTKDVALKLLDNMASKQSPFKPAEGLGGCSWFTTEGNPYTGVSPDKNVNVQVEIAKGSKPLIFREADLQKTFQQESAPAVRQAELEYREKFKISSERPLSNRQLKDINRTLARFTEKRMWRRVGEIIASSSEKVGEIVLEPGGQFSRTPGKFTAVADARKVSLKGGTGPLIKALEQSGAAVEPVVVEAAQALATKMKWAGRVRTGFRYGGRILIVVAVAMDAVEIYRAKDRKKAVVTTVGGWAGATAGAALFAELWTPMDLAGPWAWAIHGVGTLAAGGLGYWVGSNVTREIYEIWAD